METHGGVQSTEFCTSADDLVRLLLKLQVNRKNKFRQNYCNFSN